MCTCFINSGSSLSWLRKLIISFMVPTKPAWSGLVLSTQNLSYNFEFVHLPSWYRPQLSCQPTIWTDIKQSQIQTKGVKTDRLGKPCNAVLLKAFSARDAEEQLFWDTLIQTWSRLWEARVGKHLENSLNPGWGLSATLQDCVCSDFFPRAFSVPLWTSLRGKRRESPVKDESSASVLWCSLISL